MLDYQEDYELTNLNIENAKKYGEALQLSAQANIALDKELTTGSRMSNFISTKGKNIGRDMALLMLLEYAKTQGGAEEQRITALYTQAKEQEAIARAYEKVIETTAGKLSYNQSLMKYCREHD